MALEHVPFRIQLNSTVFRSSASFAGVYASGNTRGLCALAVNGPLSGRPSASAALLQAILRRSMFVIPLVQSPASRERQALVLRVRPSIPP
jgi:hypothetical protein